MLPNRSKRYAGIDGEIPRLKLATGWQLFLIGLLMTTLLVLIFPRRELVAKLYEQETLDELTLSYIQNLYRASTRNLDVAILLARVQQEKLDLPTLELMLLPSASDGDLRQRLAARTILLGAYSRRMAGNLNREQLAKLKRNVSALLLPALEDPLPDAMTQRFADLAFTLDQPEIGLRFLEKAHLNGGPQALEDYARRALAVGNYRLSSRYYFMAQERADNMDLHRRLFVAGVDTLMAGGLYQEAISAARAHVATLAQDSATLRHLARTALAAGAPEEAADYARALVFQVKEKTP